MPTLFQANGAPIEIGASIGKGGEGSVHEIPNDPGLAVKRYHQPIDSPKAEKLEAMVQLGTERLLSLSAWPISTVSAKRGGPPVGLVMRRVTGYKEVHHLYSPKSRKVEFGNADWRFLIHASTNLARVVAVVHEHGHVIGDVNHGNFMIDPQAMAVLIDCDSLQIEAPGKEFLCEVGVPTYTPPELQNRPFAGLRRTANHDNFGLAVLIFHHLFMGRHPFAGRYQGPGDMSIERAISEYRFAFGRNAGKLNMSPPPHTLALGAVSEGVAGLFERAFGQGSERPDARPHAIEWIAGLDALAKELRRCANNPAHYYYSALASCPWCEIEGTTGVVLFSVFVSAPSGSTVDVALIWTQIQAIPMPGPRPSLTAPGVQASEAAIHFGLVRRGRTIWSWIIFVVTQILIFSFHLRGLHAFWVFAGTFVACFGLLRSVPKGPKNALRQAVAAANEVFRNVEARWTNEAGDETFLALRNQLEAQHREYNSLPALRQHKYQELVANIRQAQFTRFLESQYIEYASIPRIGPGRKAILASFGIETAADITTTALSGISGFGPAYRGNLLRWRASLEATFHFDPASGVYPKDVQALDNEMVKRRSEIESSLSKGKRQLEQMRTQIATARTKLLPEYETAWKTKLQLEADLHVM
jgi:DNA-binding helix-hairpin-helix protein with protein kinase domain